MKYYSIKILSDEKICDIENDNDKFENNEEVIVEINKIQELAIILDSYEAESTKNDLMDINILRIVNNNDKKKITENKKSAQGYIPECQDIVDQKKLGMNILDADLSFDQKKLTFYFSAHARVDFRQLVGELIRKYKKMIRLQQVGSREQVKKTGGYGKCGQEVCCKRFLHKLGDVEMAYAINQNMVDLSAKKLNGLCGKTMCCMAYENEVYLKAKKKMPKVGDVVKTNKGKAEVIKQNVIKNKVKIKFNNGDIEEVSL